MKDFDLNRFLAGQSFDYDWALKEIQAGKKAEAYLRHEVLNARLREISAALLRHRGTPISEIMPGIDCLTLKSSMTMFDAICLNDIFDEVLLSFFEGKRDKVTLRMIEGE